MANQLGMALSEAIVALHRRGWSKRRIARQLGVIARWLSVIGHFKLGHPWSLQNRPPDKYLFLCLRPVF